MASPSSAQKKRPPPIELPSTFCPPHQVPRIKAFATAEGYGREQQDRARADAYHQTRPHTRDGSDTPQIASFQHAENVERLPRSNSVTGKFRKSASTTFTNIVDHARGGLSPKKGQSQPPQTSDQSHGSAHASAEGSHVSTSRPRPSERKHRPDLSSVGEEHRTLRGEMEKQKERKLFKLMGTVPDTPTDGQWSMRNGC